MAKQNPDSYLVKIGDGADPVVYSTLAGVRTRNLTLDGETVDVTTITSAAAGGYVWREQAQGVRQVSFSGNGFFEDAAQLQRLIDTKMAGEGTDDFQIIVPGLGTFEGKFMVDSVGVGADIGGGAVTMEFGLSSSGVITFTAE